MTIAVINHGVTPPDLRSFTPARYLERAVLDAEWRRVWRDTWLLAGLESDLRETGDYFVFDLGREQILLSRDGDGMLRAFFNVCQHRGNRLVRDPLGHADNFRCAYHAWTYDLHGRLAAVPFRERFEAPLCDSERSLTPVAVEAWNGLVFVHLGPDPRPLRDDLGAVAELLEPYRFAEMTLIEDQTVRLECNWKAVVDNFSELYHVDFLHPQHKRMVDCSNDTVHLFGGGHTGLEVPGATVNPRFPIPQMPTDIQSAQLRDLGLDPGEFRGRVAEIRRAVQRRKRQIGPERGFDYTRFSDDQLSDVWQFNLFPNAILSFSTEHLWILRPRPHPSDPGRCEFDKLTLVRFADPALAARAAPPGSGREAFGVAGAMPAGHTRPRREVFGYEAVIRGEKSMTDTIDQDVELLGHVQAGMASSGFGSIILSEDELRIAHFHAELDARLGG